MARDGDPREAHVNDDEAQALSRATGGVENPSHPDQASTTGTTPTEVFVGRVSGDDPGYAEETGAERRAESEAPQEQHDD